MAESEEELKSFLVKMKEESEKAGLKLNIPWIKIMAFSPNTSWQIDGETMEKSDREEGYFVFPLSPYLKPFVSKSNSFPQNSGSWVRSQHLSQDM